MRAADLSHLWALVPVRTLSGGKSRLGEPLDAEERSELVLALLRRTVEAARAAGRISGVLVVSMDEGLLERARALGAEALLQRGSGLNEALDQARTAVGIQATAIIVLPADLPGVTAPEIDRVVEAAEIARLRNPDGAVVVLVPDRHGAGTNTLLVAPPAAIDFHFGERSRHLHAAAAEAAGATYVELDGPLAFDVDTPEDLLEADMHGLDHALGR